MELTDALLQFAKRAVLPTSLSSENIRERLSKEVRQSSVFSARTMVLKYLESAKEQVGQMLSGEQGLTAARRSLQDLAQSMGYTPGKHFGTEAEIGIPAAAKGSIRDLSSDARVKLVLTTMYRDSINRAEKIKGNGEDELYDWPCLELVRFYERDVPRGFKQTKDGLVPVPGDDWKARWKEAGGNLYDGRMIAKKDDEVWENLGSTDLFDDGRDSDVAPFWFNSGGDTIEVSRDDAIALGVIDEDDDAPEAWEPSFVDDTLDDEDKELLAAWKVDKERLSKSAKSLIAKGKAKDKATQKETARLADMGVSR